jgi:tRNA(fMet)-specific endonuclease VapC
VAGRYLLDTSVAVALLRDEPGIEERLEGEFFLNAVVLGELYYGAAASARPERNKTEVDDLAIRAVVVPSDQETGWLYGQVKARLKIAAKLIPENDMWIAASALQHGLTLVTRDAHFEVVEGLLQERW